MVLTSFNGSPATSFPIRIQASSKHSLKLANPLAVLHWWSTSKVITGVCVAMIPLLDVTVCKGCFSLLPVQTCANSSMPDSPSWARNTLRVLDMLKIPWTPFDKRRPSGRWHANKKRKHSRIIKMTIAATSNGSRSNLQSIVPPVCTSVPHRRLGRHRCSCPLTPLQCALHLQNHRQFSHYHTVHQELWYQNQISIKSKHTKGSNECLPSLDPYSYSFNKPPQIISIGKPPFLIS